MCIHFKSKKKGLKNEFSFSKILLACWRIRSMRQRRRYRKCVQFLVLIILTISINMSIFVNLQLFKSNSPENEFGCPILPADQRSDHKLFIITPTKQQWTQLADLTRLSQTLKLVDNVHWIVVEDDYNKSISVQHLLQRSCHPFTHIAYKSNNETRQQYKNSKGMPQRNVGLEVVRDRYILSSHDVVLDTQTLKKYPSKRVGTVFFADDDNTYDIQLFSFMRQLTTVGVWAVGIVGGATVEHPVVKNGTVVSWNVGYMTKRKFATDMAGFAVNLDLVLRNKNTSFHSSCKGTLYETCFIEQLHVNLTDLQPFGFSDTDKVGNKWRVYVWHTKTTKVGAAVKRLSTDFDI